MVSLRPCGGRLPPIVESRKRTVRAATTEALAQSTLNDAENTFSYEASIGFTTYWNQWLGDVLVAVWGSQAKWS
jgi:hypothetical protein